ncbi:hypothetical protein PENNAL_c0100G10080 [Penicillium nalgiovense]|uniref:Uncharacterized protein n=1 Tax=Penicillium nalgiovense TaxID=60175 RepID=A0A1V6XAD3_PENNA|nr:hypothetical protein PENNAL_c0100G10080 [Penicillium nalgiovense]
MSQEPAPGIVLLTELATIELLYEYASRAGSDGQLLYASRQNSRSINPGLFLAYTHMELISWLVKNNYTTKSTSVKWYSWKKIFSKYQIPLFSISSQTANLRENLRSIEEKAGMVYAVLQANDVSIPPTAIAYRVVQPNLPNDPLPEAFEDLLRRGSHLQQQLSPPQDQ